VTAPQREFDSLLLLGLVDVLAGAGVGVWNDRGIYPAAAVGIFMLAVPDQPDRLISLSPYRVTDDAAEAMSTEGVQVRTRWAGGNPLDVLDLDARVFGILHGMSNLTLSTGVRISQCLRRSSASLGQDSSKRWGISSNYYLDVARPASTS
jgi:hypothetical protein